MKKVFISSRFRADTIEGRDKNVAQAVHLAREAMNMGYLPILPHLYFPSLLDDFDVEARGQGIVAGLVLLEDCDELVVYDDDGISDGMAIEIAYWKAKKQRDPITWHTFANKNLQSVN